MHQLGHSFKKTYEKWNKRNKNSRSDKFLEYLLKKKETKKINLMLLMKQIVFTIKEFILQIILDSTLFLMI